MKRKPAISKRRLIIIFILCTILTASVMTGFSSGLDTDGTTYTPADGMRIVTWADIPDGATPENSDALSSLRYTAQNIYTSTYFRGETHGSCVADIGMGMEYNQEVNNTRVIYGNVMFQEAISISSLKKVANQRYIEKDTILYRPSTGISNGVPSYPDQVVHWTKEQYSEAYGAFPNELSKYVITPSTLTGIRDENGTATVKSAANASADEETNENDGAEVDENDPNSGEVAIDVPQALVKGDDGNYTFTVTLDPEKSSKFYRNEVRSLGDLSGYPEFKFVELTVTIDENFFPVSITTVEKYKISLPVVGTPTCTAVLTETFSSINEPGDVPEQEFFRTQFEATGDEPIVLPKSPSDYLLGTFQPYLDGEAELKLAADVAIGDIALNNIKLSADLKNMNVKAALDGGLYVEYAGDRVYITLNNIKGYITTDKAAALMSDERIAGLLGGLNIPDIDSYIDKDILTTVLGNCEITPEGDLTCIYLPFSLGEGKGKIDVDAKIYITEDDDKMTLRRIVGTVKYGSLEIKISASAVERVKFPVVDDGYECLDSVFELVPEIADVALETRYDISGTLEYNDTAVGVEAYIDRTDASDVKARATLDCNGIKPVVTYAGGNIYVELGSVKLKATVDEITDLVKYITELTDFELDPKLLSTLKSLLPATVTDVISMIFDLSVADGRLELGLKRMAVPVDVALSASDGKLGVDVAVKTDKFGFDIDAGISLAMTAATERDISPVGEYVSVSALKPVIDGAYGIATNKQISANVVFETGDVEIAAKLAADFADMQNLKLKLELLNADYPVKLTVIGKTAYVEINTDKYAAAVSGTLDDLNALLGLLDEYIPENIKSIVTGVLDGSLMQDIDAMNVAKTALGAVKSIAEKDGVLTVNVSYDGITATADVATDLSKIDATITANETTYTVSLDGITASANVSAPADASRFVKASDLITVAKSVMPLIGKDVYGMNVSASLFGADIDGDVAFAFDNGKIAASASINIADVAAKLYFEDDVMYMTVENTLAVKLGTTQDELEALLTKLATALPDIDFEPIEQTVDVLFNLNALLAAKLSITPYDGGIKLSADLTPASIDAAMDIALEVSDKLDGIVISGTAFGHDINIALDTILELGTLDGFNVMSGEKSLAKVTLTDATEVETAPVTDYVDADKFIDYIAPLTDLVEQAETAKRLKLDLVNAHLGDIAIDGTVTVALDKKEMFADITLFADNENEKTNLLITLKANTLYISTGNVMLYFDTAADSQRIYDVLTRYIPADNYLNKEIKKLLLPQKGDGLPEGMSVLTDALNRLITLDDAKDIFGVLFAGVYGEGSDSVIKTLLDAVRVKFVTNVFATTDLETGEPVTVSRDDLAIDIFAPFGISMRVTPIAANGKLEQIDANVSLGNMNVSLGMKLNFGADGYVAPMPDNADKYVSIADFIDAVHNAVNTVTAKNGNDITFEVSSFAFDYDIFAIEYETEKDADGNVKYVTDANGKPVLDADGNKTPVYKLDEKGNKIPVKDEAGRDSPLKKEILDENGKPVLDADGNKTYEKVVAQKIKVTSNGDSALKVRMIAEEKKDAEGNTVLDENGNTVYKYRFNLEAHVLLEVSTLVNSSPLALDLYIINDKDNPDGIVYLDYCESVKTDDKGNTTYGQGERIKLDYTSIMEIMAAAMDIMSVNDDTVEMLFGDYRQRIDKTVFESMDIAGLDSIRGMLDSLAAAVNQGKAALGDVEEAWDLVYKAGDVLELINRRDDISAKLDSAIDGIKSIMAMFSSDEETDKEAEKEERSFGELFKMIVNGISFESKKTYDESGNAISSYLKADVDNEIATQTEGTAHVTVTQSVSNDNKWLLDRIEVGNLDVNTAKLNTFDMKFKAGTDVAVKLPDNPYADKDTRTYSDFSNIKHLLFDVMNTANMLEFDIGGIDTSDSINLNFTLGSKWLAELNLTVNYNAKVKILPVGVDEKGKTQYKTAAAIEIHNKRSQVKILNIGSTIVLPECTTRLYFYDNVIYIRGVSDWSYGDENVKKTGKGIFGQQKYDSEEVFKAQFVDVAYTVDELGYMMKHDLNKFLDEFVYYLIPITNDKIAGLVDVKGIIKEQIGGSSSDNKNNPQLTIAQVFKGYTYDNGAHSLTIGLAELAGSDSLDDLHLSITGVNDGDDNLLDNYISTLHINTTLVNMLTVKLDATLRNTSTPTKYYDDEEFAVPAASGAVTEYARNELESTGLGTFCPFEDKVVFTYKGAKYVRVDGYTGDDYLIDNGNVRALDESERVHYTIESAISSLLAEVTLDKNGKIVSVENRPGGVQWTRPWTEVYESSLAA